MITVPVSVREVKTPQPPPRDDDPTARRDRAWHRIQRSLEVVARIDDAEVLEQIDGAIDDVLAELQNSRSKRPAMSRRDSGVYPVALAEHLASGAWMRDQP